jgi:ribonucleoside-diphosphate reductase alpha chain
VLVRGAVDELAFHRLMQRVEDSKCGEPGVYWTNNPDWGTNPCCEIALEPFQMCNLTEINASLIQSQSDFDKASYAASVIGTLQAGYTDFHYLRPMWRETCERAALLGVSMTGIASGTVEKLNMQRAAQAAKLANETYAKAIGINPSERITTVKPAGTTSLALGCSSGIHAWHNDFYIRRMRAGKNEPLAQYMMRVAPSLVEQDVMAENQVVLSFPQKAPAGATLRTEPMINLLERVKLVSDQWVRSGHVKGDNYHNVSCTISVKDDEWPALVTWMWENREYYNGISVLPYFGSEAYPQLPFEDCSEEVYKSMRPALKAINLDEVYEEDGTTINLAQESACAGGFCEVAAV